MIETKKNYAFIDSQNLNLATKALGWKIDWRRFRVYLTNKYKIQRAYLFIGFLEEHADLYKSLQEKGYILIFKPTHMRRSRVFASRYKRILKESF
jgi:hypothetical protein